MGSPVATVAGLADQAQQPVHPAHRGQVYALIEQSRRRVCATDLSRNSGW
jgi:hypothetical protein